MDTHADTTALGSNFVALYFTGQCVDVTPFSKEYAATTNIPVAQGATAYTDKQTGITYILIVNEGLWFGNRMKHSLINPNQLRKFGIDLCDILLTLIVLCVCMTMTPASRFHSKREVLLFCLSRGVQLKRSLILVYMSF